MRTKRVCFMDTLGTVEDGPFGIVARSCDRQSLCRLSCASESMHRLLTEFLLDEHVMHVLRRKRSNVEWTYDFRVVPKTLSELSPCQMWRLKSWFLPHGILSKVRSLGVWLMSKDINFQHGVAPFFADVMHMQSESLCRISIHGNEGLSRNHIHELAVALCGSSRIQEFELTHNSLSNLAGHDLVLGLTKSSCRLTSLNLSDSGLGSAFDGAAIYDLLRRNTSLRDINLSSNAFTDSSMRCVLRGLSYNSTLVKMDLSGNVFGITEEDVWIGLFSQALHTKSSLEELRFVNCQIGDFGASELANALYENHTLTTLNLDTNGITNTGSCLLFQSLIGNSTLQTLLLPFNSVTEVFGGEDDMVHVGACHISSFLKNNDTLQHLDLSANDLGDEAGVQIAESLKKNSKLSNLSVRVNCLSETTMLAFVDCLAVNSSLELIDIQHNFTVCAETKEKLRKAAEMYECQVLGLEETDSWLPMEDDDDDDDDDDEDFAGNSDESESDDDDSEEGEEGEEEAGDEDSASSETSGH